MDLQVSAPKHVVRVAELHQDRESGEGPLLVPLVRLDKLQLVVVVVAGCTGVGLDLAADRRLWRRHDVRNGAIEDGDGRGDAWTAGASRRRRRLLGPLVRLGRLKLLVVVAAGCIGLVVAPAGVFGGDVMPATARSRTAMKGEVHGRRDHLAEGRGEGPLVGPQVVVAAGCTCLDFSLAVSKHL